MATMPNTIIVCGDGVSDQEAIAELDRFFEGARQDRLALLSAQSEIRRLERENAELKEKSSGWNVLESEYESEIRRLETVNAERSATLNAAEVDRERWVKAWYAQAQEVERLQGENEALKEELTASPPASRAATEPVPSLPVNPPPAVDMLTVATWGSPTVWADPASVAATPSITVGNARQPAATQGSVADDFAAYMRAAGTTHPGWSVIGYRDAVRRFLGLGDKAEAEDDREVEDDACTPSVPRGDLAGDLAAPATRRHPMCDPRYVRDTEKLRRLHEKAQEMNQAWPFKNEEANSGD